MPVRRSFKYKHRVFSAGELSRTFGKLAGLLGSDPGSITFSVTEVLADGTTSESQRLIKDTETICDLERHEIATRIESPDKEVLAASASVDHRGHASFHLVADSPTRLSEAKEILEESLKLEEAPKSKDLDANTLADAVNHLIEETIAPALKRLEALEEQALLSRKKLRCFLSYRFTDDIEVLALRLQQYLSLLDVEVLTGASYEPRQVSEKVLSRLREPLDFIILLITRHGESAWTRDEIGVAIHKGIALVPLVEKGSSLQPGLFADIEYIEFESGHIGDTFVKLLQAVKFIGEQRTTREAERVGAESVTANPVGRADG